MSRKITKKEKTKELTADTVTREELGTYIFNHGIEFEPLQLDYLWAQMQVSTDKDHTINLLIRFVLEQEVEDGVLPEDQLGHERSEPWV